MRVFVFNEMMNDDVVAVVVPTTEANETGAWHKHLYNKAHAVGTPGATV
jgi:hypothetical protein